MSTIGLGDRTPKTSAEKIFVVFMSIVACGVFGYSISAISSILQEMNKKDEEM